MSSEGIEKLLTPPYLCKLKYVTYPTSCSRAMIDFFGSYTLALGDLKVTAWLEFMTAHGPKLCFYYLLRLNPFDAI